MQGIRLASLISINIVCEEYWAQQTQKYAAELAGAGVPQAQTSSAGVNPQARICSGTGIHQHAAQVQRQTASLAGLSESVATVVPSTQHPTLSSAQPQPVNRQSSGNDAMEEFYPGDALHTDETNKFLRDSVCVKYNVDCSGPWTNARLLDKLIGDLIKPPWVSPAFITGHPQVVSPLSKNMAHAPACPSALKGSCRLRFEEHARQKEQGDGEAQGVDEIFKADAGVVHPHNRSHDLEVHLSSEGESIQERLQIAEVKLADIQNLEREASGQNAVLVSEWDTLLDKLKMAHAQVAHTKRGEESYRERFAETQMSLKVLQEHLDDQSVALRLTKESMGEAQDHLQSVNNTVL
ncbi:hypothetical protein EDB19DRAFT_1907809 [Suillus lakei]|nr:hypothetical protein EDB19DRAFT_1907809 [Suillus lakei]